MTEQEPVPREPLHRRIGRWIWGHKVKTVLVLVLVLLLAELLTVPFFSIARLKKENPERTALMQQRQREAAREGRSLAIVHRWVPLSRLPRHVIDAVVVAEDGTFFAHNGIDWFEVQASLEKNVRSKRVVRGASTITQQLAKNLYLSTSRDPIRKLKELLITVLLEKELTKNRILEIYLNSIEWGRGIFGIEAAAQTYFHKSAGALTLEEATRLAAVIPSPLRHRPDTDSRYVVRRKGMVLRRMEARDRGVESADSLAEDDTTETNGGDSNGL